MESNIVEDPTIEDGTEPYLTPDDYPAECTINAVELRKLKNELTTREEWRCHVEEWPPTDEMGNVYPIFFTVDEIDEQKGQLTDKWGGTYSPFAGNLEPKMHERWTYCNAPLSKWRYRYPEIRYCSGYVDEDRGYDVYCKMHEGRHNVKSAEETIQTGLQVKTMDHLYEDVGPWKKLVGWGTYESLMGESAYEFAPSYEPRTFDFSDEPLAPDDADDDGILQIKCAYPTDHVQPSLALFVAAMQQVQMLTVQPKIMYEDREAGQGMMETKSVEKAQLTSPTDADPTQQFRTIETWNEHHLNLPLSRLIKDQPRLLEMGGVTTDPEEATDGPSGEDIVLEVDADVEGVETTDDTGTDPNAFGEDYTSESEKIVEKASDNNHSQ